MICLLNHRFIRKGARAASKGAVLCFLAGAHSAFAQSKLADYPVRALRLVNPYSPGGTTDLVARMVATRLTELWGQQIIVDNRPGAGTNIGNEIVARAQPDGYTLLVNSAAIATLSGFYSRLSYDPVKDLAAVANVGDSPLVMSVHPAVEIRSVRELIDYARAKPKQLTISSSGTGSSTHLAQELFKSMAKIDIIHVPYKGGGPAVVAAVSGEVNAIINSPAVVLPHVKSGRLRGLAVTSSKRSDIAPDLPTIAEAGGLPGYEVQGWYGVFAPRATPRRIVDAINSELDRYGQSTEGRARLLSFGLTPTGGSPAVFAEYFRLETERWVRVIRAAGIKND
jgi:tripartite-type tricarboxylate transporter receptor subunit TctC